MTSKPAMKTQFRHEARSRKETVGLFIPCYVDLFYPRVGLATLQILEQCGFAVDFPEKQTCCGPADGQHRLRRPGEAPRRSGSFASSASTTNVVAPSGSCVAKVRHHYEAFLAGVPSFDELKARTFELCEFLTDVVRVREVDGKFPHRVGLHQSCHGLRELRLGSSSELGAPGDPARRWNCSGRFAGSNSHR